MNGNAYRLVEIIKQKKNITSDYAVSKLVNVSRMVVNGWKNGKNPDALNTLRLIDAAGLSVKEAIEILEAGEPQQKKLFGQGGFGSLSLIFVTALLSTLGLALILTSGRLYIMLNGIRKKTKAKLLRFAFQYRLQPVCIYLLQTN